MAQKSDEVRKKTGKALFGLMNFDDGLQVVGGDEDCFYGILSPEMVSDKSFMWNIISKTDNQNPYLVRFTIRQ